MFDLPSEADTDRGTASIIAVLGLVGLITISTVAIGATAFHGLKQEAHTNHVTVTGSTVRALNRHQLEVKPGLSDPLPTHNLKIRVSFPKNSKNIPPIEITNLHQALTHSRGNSSNATKTITVTKREIVRQKATTTTKKVHRREKIYQWHKPASRSYTMYRWVKRVGNTVHTVEAHSKPGRGWHQGKQVNTVTENGTVTVTAPNRPQGDGWIKGQFQGVRNISVTVPVTKKVPVVKNVTVQKKVPNWVWNNDKHHASGDNQGPNSHSSDVAQAQYQDNHHQTNQENDNHHAPNEHANYHAKDAHHGPLGQLIHTLPFVGDAHAHTNGMAATKIVQSTQLAQSPSSNKTLNPGYWKSGQSLYVNLNRSVIQKGDLIHVTVIDTQSNQVLISKTRRVRTFLQQVLSQASTGQGTANYKGGKQSNIGTPGQKAKQAKKLHLSINGKQRVTSAKSYVYHAKAYLGNKKLQTSKIDWKIAGKSAHGSPAAITYPTLTSSATDTLHVHVKTTNYGWINTTRSVTINPLPNTGGNTGGNTGTGGSTGGSGVGSYVNTAPTAVLHGPNSATIHNGHAVSVSLNGRQSQDPDGDSLTYHWSLAKVSGTKASRSAVHNLGSSGATDGVSISKPGAYTFKLTVHDGHGHSDSATKTVDVSSTGTGKVGSGWQLSVSGSSKLQPGQTGNWQAQITPNTVNTQSFTYRWEVNHNSKFGSATTYTVPSSMQPGSTFQVKVTAQGGGKTETATKTVQVVSSNTKYSTQSLNKVKNARITARQTGSKNHYIFTVHFTDPGHVPANVRVHFSNGDTKTTHVSAPTSGNQYQASVSETFQKHSNAWITGIKSEHQTVTAHINAQGASGSTSHGFNVNVFTHGNTPVYSFTAQGSTFKVGQKVTFNVNPPNDPYWPKATFHFGDGGTAVLHHHQFSSSHPKGTHEQVSHIYHHPGTYTVTLTQQVQTTAQGVQFWSHQHTREITHKVTIHVQPKQSAKQCQPAQQLTATKRAFTKPGSGWQKIAGTGKTQTHWIPNTQKTTTLQKASQLGSGYQLRQPLGMRRVTRTKTKVSKTSPGSGWTKQGVSYYTIARKPNYKTRTFWSSMADLGMWSYGSNLHRTGKTKKVWTSTKTKKSISSPGLGWSRGRQVGTKTVRTGTQTWWSQSYGLQYMGPSVHLVRSKRVQTGTRTKTIHHSKRIPHTHWKRVTHHHSRRVRHTGHYTTYSRSCHSYWSWSSFSYKTSCSWVSHRHTYHYYTTKHWTTHSWKKVTTYTTKHWTTTKQVPVYTWKYEYSKPTYKQKAVYQWSKKVYTTKYQYSERYQDGMKTVDVPHYKWTKPVHTMAMVGVFQKGYTQTSYKYQKTQKQSSSCQTGQSA